MPVIALAVLGVTVLMPGAKWTPDSVMMQQAMQSMPEGVGVWGVIWGFWHAPLILNGHNYPQHPVVGVFMMVAFSMRGSPKSGFTMVIA